MTALFVPEAAVERFSCFGSVFLEPIGLVGAARLAQPALKKLKGVVPKRVDFDCFAAPGRHYPILDFCIHPRELITLLTLHQQTVIGIYVDIEPGSTEM